METGEATPQVALGAYIRSQRQAAGLSLRRLAAESQVSNAYLSQVERGLHQPSLKVLSAIGRALDITPQELIAEAGVSGPTRSNSGEDSRARTLGALRSDTLLTHEQRDAMINLYRIFVAHHPGVGVDNHSADAHSTDNDGADSDGAGGSETHRHETHRHETGRPETDRSETDRSESDS